MQTLSYLGLEISLKKKAQIYKFILKHVDFLFIHVIINLSHLHYDY